MDEAPKTQIQKYDPEFLAQIEKTLAFEGRWNPSDPGGGANFGINQRSHPNVDIKNLTRDQAIEIYWNEYWLKPGVYKLKGDVAGKVFDFGVVAGIAQAPKILARALRAVDCLTAARNQVEEASELTPAIVATANTTTNVPALLAALRSECAAYFRIVDAIQHQTHGGNHPYLATWLKRAYS